MQHKAYSRNERNISRLKGDFLSGIQKFFLLINLIIITLGGVLLHLLEYEAIKDILLYIVMTIAVYFVVAHLTLLPPSLVLPLVIAYPLIPKKVFFPFLAVSVLLSFFILFAI